MHRTTPPFAFSSTLPLNGLGSQAPQNESQAETPIDPLHFDISGPYFRFDYAY